MSRGCIHPGRDYASFVGKQIGEWTVLGLVPGVHVGGARFVVRCSCGRELERNAGTIVRGKSKRCSVCAKKSPFVDPGVDALVGTKWGDRMVTGICRPPKAGPYSRRQPRKLIVECQRGHVVHYLRANILGTPAACHRCGGARRRAA